MADILDSASLSEQGTIAGRSDYHVYYEDTDFSGFVYHANYLKYFERAREHVIGIEALKQWFRDGIHFVVAKAELSFHAPGRHGDLLAILSKATYGRSSRLPFHHEAWLVEEGKLTKKLVSGIVDIVTLGKDNRPTRLPDLLVAHFKGREPG